MLFLLILIDLLEGVWSLEVVKVALINIFILTIDQESNMKGVTCSDEPHKRPTITTELCCVSHVSFRHVEPIFQFDVVTTLRLRSSEGFGTITTW